MIGDGLRAVVGQRPADNLNDAAILRSMQGRKAISEASFFCNT